MMGEWISSRACGCSAADSPWLSAPCSPKCGACTASPPNRRRTLRRKAKTIARTAESRFPNSFSMCHLSTCLFCYGPESIPLRWHIGGSTWAVLVSAWVLFYWLCVLGEAVLVSWNRNEEGVNLPPGRWKALADVQRWRKNNQRGEHDWWNYRREGTKFAQYSINKRIKWALLAPREGMIELPSGLEVARLPRALILTRNKKPCRF